MIHFIRLTRPVNLAIMALTMYGLGLYFESNSIRPTANGVQSFTFFILVLSTLLIAAAGNIINDYFDVRADRINKPERMIINRYIDRRMAILSHWTMNVAAFLMALYLSIKLESFLYLFVHLLMINSLWFYSTSLKRKYLIGNIQVAVMTALIPMLTGAYYSLHTDILIASSPFPFDNLNLNDALFIISAGFGLFAFLLNFAREIVKDVEDIEGDLLLPAKTLAIIEGPSKALRYTAFILGSALLLVLLSLTLIDWMQFNTQLPLLINAVLISGVVLLSIGKNASHKIKLIDYLLKGVMIIGILAPYYWIFISGNE